MSATCAAPNCIARSAVRVRGSPLCQRHWHEVQRWLAARGMALGAYTGNILDLLPDHVGLSRVLTDQFLLVRLASAKAGERLQLVIEIQNTRVELRYARGQWAAMTASGPAHKRANLVQALERLDRHIRELESTLGQLTRTLVSRLCHPSTASAHPR
jgi:hypothetical protein